MPYPQKTARSEDLVVMIGEKVYLQGPTSDAPGVPIVRGLAECTKLVRVSGCHAVVLRARGPTWRPTGPVRLQLQRLGQTHGGGECFTVRCEGGFAG